MFILENPDHEWNRWDFRLTKAYELYKDLMQGGVPIYWDRSDRVAFEAGSFISKSKAALDRAEEKASAGKKKNYGKVFYPIPKTIDGGPLPTLDDFLAEQRAKKEMAKEGAKFASGNPQFDNANWKPPASP
jgi:hypothetical protein